MDIERAKKVFPKFFENFEYKIPEGAKAENIEVYRLCLSGSLDREAFYGSYECAIIKKLSVSKEITEDSKDPGHYSTSCFEKARDIRNMKKCFTKHAPEVIVAKGITESSCGVCQRTKERTGKNNSHIDWWVYEESNPQNHFKVVSDDEIK
ncbi:hypothetical protein [Clostridium butyricum]|uniref:hypothetical protein n=1 Tax=Clostridium butyricum TaxID=1492 RepID=UPI00374E4B8A